MIYSDRSQPLTSERSNGTSIASNNVFQFKSSALQQSKPPSGEAQAVVPALEVTAQSLDLFNHHERVESHSLDVTEYEQLMDFHKRME